LKDGEPIFVDMAADTQIEVSMAVAHAVRRDWGRLLAALTKSVGDISLAEDSLQDAVEAALVHWERTGVPRSPPAWLMQTARRKAIDRLRRAASFDAKRDQIAHLMALDQSDISAADCGRQNAIVDHRLELIFTCCHPAIEEKTRIALTLRTLCGLRSPMLFSISR